MYKLSFVEQATARLLLPAGGGEDIRPQLRRVCKSMGAVKSLDSVNDILQSLHENEG